MIGASGDLLGGRGAPHSEASTECSFRGSAKLADLAKSCRDDYQGKIKIHALHCFNLHNTGLRCTFICSVDRASHARTCYHRSKLANNI